MSVCADYRVGQAAGRGSELVSWHESDVPALLAYVGYRWKSGKHLLAVRFTGFDPHVWSGRALQENFLRVGDVRSCINVSGL